jgi:hypothetical protein
MRWDLMSIISRTIRNRTYQNLFRQQRARSRLVAWVYFKPAEERVHSVVSKPPFCSLLKYFQLRLRNKRTKPSWRKRLQRCYESVKVTPSIRGYEDVPNNEVLVTDEFKGVAIAAAKRTLWVLRICGTRISKSASPCACHMKYDLDIFSSFAGYSRSLVSVESSEDSGRGQ